MNKLQADFQIIDETIEYVLIEDLYDDKSPTKTVTNDAENVVKNLWKNYELGTRRLLYIDTDEQIDELLHEKGIFKGFKAGHEGINLRIY